MNSDIKLGVNIDHVATLRQARGVDYPSVLEAARLCEEAGAHGITVHLREDRRHIQDVDVLELRKTLGTRLNLEMANAAEIVEIALKVVPEEVCLVPEKREELTTEGGLDVVGQKKDLATTVERLTGAGIIPSMFIDPDPEQIAASAEIGAPCIELHTGTFCDSAGPAAEQELERLVRGAEQGHGLGLQVNAGHGINLANIDKILVMPHLDTLNIGHSIVARAVFVGIQDAVREMLEKMAAYTGGTHG
ncbi:pyridoxine 5'-phosphate synthase [Verrucomicrobiota bacterium]